MNIDWNFISAREGGSRLKGYIPKANGEVLDSSGVTIATGFDIGQYSENDLVKLGLPDDLIDLLAPYCLARGLDADEMLSIHGAPEITDTEAFALDNASHTRTVDLLKKKFNKEAYCRFEALHPQIQTAIASVAFQYGIGLKYKTPMFWKQITTHDWDGVLSNLRNFGDKYPTRRNLEADLIDACMS